MKLLTLFLLLLASPAYALPVTFQFSGVMAGRSTIEGSFSYDSEAAPVGVNVRGLNGNLAYQLTDWSITVRPDNALLWFVNAPLPESIVFSPENSTSDFCLNRCIFSGTPVERLFFTNGQHSLQLSFNVPDLGTMSSPPTSLEQWGSLWTNASEFNSVQQYVMIVNGGAIANVPEPSTWMLFAVGMGALVLWRKRRGGH